MLKKYTLDGDTRWVRYYDDPLNRDESVSGLAVAGSAVYVCGSGKATVTKPGDALLVKYLSDGTIAWARWSAGSAGGEDGWNDVAVDAKGRAHVTGYHKRAGTGTDIVTAMYSTAGVMTWGRGFSSTGKRPDVGTGLAVDADGRTYVSGWRTGSDLDTDWVTLKYGTTGATLWTTVYPDPDRRIRSTRSRRPTSVTTWRPTWPLEHVRVRGRRPGLGPRRRGPRGRRHDDRRDPTLSAKTKGRGGRVACDPPPAPFCGI